MKLQTVGLRKEFSSRGQRVVVLDGIDLDLREGEFVSIVGTSGCGKTTFIKIIDGLVPATAGQVLIDGRPVTAPGPDRGFVFQHGALLPWRTVLDNVAWGLKMQGRSLRERREMAQQLITMAGLEGFERHYPHEISGGMRQRVNLARALAIDPEVLLMDEPFAALDAQLREVMQQELLRIWSERQKTVLFITHQIDEAVYLSDRVVVFSARPATVLADIRIELDRPRLLSVKRTARFGEYEEEVWRLIERQVKEAERIG